MLMNTLKFAWRNIWRNRRRTFFTILAIGMGLVTLIFARSYIQGIMTKSLETVIKTQIGHIRIAHREYLRLERIFPKEYMLRDVSKIRAILDRQTGIRHLDERIMMPLLLNYGDTNEPGVAVGVDPAAIEQSMQLSESLVAGGFFPAGETRLVIGAGLAGDLGTEVDDELLLVTTDINYSTYALPFNVAGIFETGYSVFDKHMLYLPLKKARLMLDAPDSAHEILIFLEDPRTAVEKAKEIQAAIDRIFPGRDYLAIPYQQNDLVQSFMPVMEKTFGNIIGIIMFIVALVILNTMLMAVMERFQEIGVLKAMGFTNGNVIGMILFEALFVGTIGSLGGGLAGGLLSALLEKKGLNYVKMMGAEVWKKLDMPIPFFSKMMYPDLTAEILISSILFGILITLLAVLYPAYKTLKMRPVDAFRSKLTL